MVKLTKALFAVTDVMSVMIAGFALTLIVAAPIFGPVYSRMTHQASSGWPVAVGLTFWGLVAAACVLIRRHHAGGLVCALAAAVLVTACGSAAAGLVVFLVALLFGAPFALVLVQAVKEAGSSPGA